MVKDIKPLSTFSNTIWNALGCLFYLGCQWLTTVMVVRLSSSYSNSGLYAFAMASGVIFASIALYKVRTFQVSDLNNEFSSRQYIAFRLVTILIGWIACIVYIPIATGFDVSYVMISCLYLIFKSDESFSDVLYGIYQKNGRMDFIGISQFLRGLLSLGLFSLALFINAELSFSIVLMTLGCLSVTFFFDLPHARLFGEVKPDFDFAKLFNLGKICLLAMVASLFANSIVSVVRQYFGIVQGSEALGHYASVATPAVLIQVAATYLYSPLISSLASDLKKSFGLFVRSFVKVLFVLIVIMGVFIVLLSFAGNTILVIAFGKTIEPYCYLFPYVLIATAAIGILLYCNDVLIIERRMKSILACNALAFAAALFSSYFLIDSFGMNGINFSIIFGSSVAVLSALFCIFRK